MISQVLNDFACSPSLHNELSNKRIVLSGPKDVPSSPQYRVLIAGVCFSQNSLSLAGNLGAILTGIVFAWLESNEEGSQGPVQSTPDISNLQGKSKEVRVIGSSKQVTENKEWDGGERDTSSNAHFTSRAARDKLRF